MDIFQFFARFHVLILHLPIGILMLSALMELAIIHGKKTRATLLNWIWFWGAVSAVAACVLGWMLSQAEGYNPDAVFVHRTFGISVAAIAFICWWYFKRSLTSGKVIGSFLAVAQLLLLFMTGHYGANMTHGETYLVEHAPNAIRAIVGLPPHAVPRPPVKSLDGAFVYEDLINPMLQRRCVSCHNESKQKGKLNLSSVDGLNRSGKSGDTILPGNADESELYRRITLDHDEKEFMPAEGKKPLTDEQVAIFKWWIDTGAPTQGKVTDYIESKDSTLLISSILGLDTTAFPPIAPITDEQKTKLVAAGFVVKEVAQQLNYLDLDLSVSKATLSPETITLLKETAPNIAYLNLSRTLVPAEFLVAIAEFTNLQKLRLDYTNVDSQSLSTIVGLDRLTYLNLYASQVDDDIFDTLMAMPSVEHVYLNQTNVTQVLVEKIGSSSSSIKLHFNPPTPSARHTKQVETE